LTAPSNTEILSNPLTLLASKTWKSPLLQTPLVTIRGKVGGMNIILEVDNFVENIHYKEKGKKNIFQTSRNIEGVHNIISFFQDEFHESSIISLDIGP
jgi:hypothetical protein